MNSQPSKGAKIPNSTSTSVSANLQNDTNGLSSSNRTTSNVNSLNTIAMLNELTVQQKIKLTNQSQQTNHGNVNHDNHNNGNHNSNHSTNTQLSLINLTASNLVNSHNLQVTKSSINSCNQSGQQNSAQLNDNQLGNQINNQLNNQHLNNQLTNQNSHQIKQTNHQINQQRRTDKAINNSITNLINNSINQSNQPVVNYDQMCNSLPDSPETTNGQNTIAIYDQEIDEFLQQHQMNLNPNNGQILNENLIESSFIDGKWIVKNFKI